MLRNQWSVSRGIRGHFPLEPVVSFPRNPWADWTGIRNDILKKPGKLTYDEFEIMKTHCQIGADVIGDDSSELLQLAKEIALTHHEKWNGSGYPNKLAGEETPLPGRIVAIADVFDALTSVRPYKKAWTTEEAVALIEKEAGKHFDPDLVQLFLKSLSKVISIKEKYYETMKCIST